MRINHKSDFDFRLDLYAADPYGTAVASGFPDCDFTGKLFIGPSVRNHKCYIFSKSSKVLFNCFDVDGHLHIVVSDHNLSTGPLYCELSLSVPDSNYPSGLRTVVYDFPLNIYLTDSDSDKISPTVSVTLPLLQKTIFTSSTNDEDSNNDNTQDDGINTNPITGTDNAVTSIRAISRFSEPWLSPRVCGRSFRSGAYAGNIYRNEGKMYLTGFVKEWSDQKWLLINIPRICSLTNLSENEILANLNYSGGKILKQFVRDNNMVFEYATDKPVVYLYIPKSKYVTISPGCKIVLLNEIPIGDYITKPLTMKDIQNHFKFFHSENKGRFQISCTSRFVIQIWKLNLRKPVLIDGKTHWLKPKVRQMTWVTKKHGKIRAIRPIFFRAARKSNGKLSEWSYFKLYYNPENKRYEFIKTNEAGRSLSNRWFV